MSSISTKNASQVNTMISEEFEVFHVEDFVETDKTLYHYHDFYEIHITLDGTAHFYLDGHQFEIEPGSVLLINMNESHRIVRQDSEHFERVYIFITDLFLNRMSTRYTNLGRCFKSGNRKKSKVLKVDPVQLKEYLTFIDAVPDITQYGEDLLYEQQLVQLLVYLNQEVEQQEHLVSTPMESDRDIDKIIQHISEHLAEDLSLETIAKLFYLNKYYIIREFKKATGQTYYHYVLEKRLLLAKHLLKTSKKANDVYLECGFKTYSHFLKSFKKMFHMTPKEFLEQSNDGQVHFKHYEDG